MNPLKKYRAEIIIGLVAGLLLLGVLEWNYRSTRFPPQTVTPPGRTVHYDGSISREKNRTFFQALKNIRVRKLVIRSDGGSVEAGINLGYWVYKHKIDVEVDGYCLSSCANYVFTAGKRKIIRRGAIVAWHGNYHHLEHTGSWRDDVPGRMRRTGETRAVATQTVLAQVKKLVRLEKAFFSSIGVRQYLCWIGKMAPYLVPDYYILSGQDMARFGLSGLVLPAGYEKSTSSRFRVRFIRLKKITPPVQH